MSAGAAEWCFSVPNQRRHIQIPAQSDTVARPEKRRTRKGHRGGRRWRKKNNQIETSAVESYVERVEPCKEVNSSPSGTADPLTTPQILVTFDLVHAVSGELIRSYENAIDMKVSFFLNGLICEFQKYEVQDVTYKLVIGEHVITSSENISRTYMSDFLGRTNKPGTVSLVKELFSPGGYDSSDYKDFREPRRPSVIAAMCRDAHFL